MTACLFVRGGAAALLLFTCGSAVCAEPFPFDQDLLLDAAPMRPGKRMPMLNVETNGNARIDLWCRTVPARVAVSDAAIKIEAGPLPETAPEMQSAGQCTPERMQADEQLLAVLLESNAWRAEGPVIVLDGPKPLKFRLSDH
jgi:heat shock protein HslJ